MRIKLPLHRNKDLVGLAKDLADLGLEATAYTILDQRNREIIEHLSGGKI